MSMPEEILKKYWGYDTFRPLQKQIIDSVLNDQDTLALMPTGGGKSICFQVPAFFKEGLCLVISPLIALMKDQVENLKKKGIPALLIHSGMNFREVKSTLQNAAYGNFKFLYVSPERLETDLFLEFLPIIKINLIAVDEAHCISQWGYDFRPTYLKIAGLREKVPDIPLLALTASATLNVQKDIGEKLAFKTGAKIFQQSFARPNLSYSAFELSSKQNKLIEIIRKVPGSGIVYCRSRRRTREIADLLNLYGIKADFYHAGLSNDERNKKQEAWIENRTRIICCTNAFGMGIDKPDVRVVVHYDVPEALENYYQEAGRAGRDGEKSYAVLLFNNNEIAELNNQPAIKYPSLQMIRKVYGALCNFFQLPSGNGLGLSYDFDINIFVKNFKLEIFMVSNVLKILEQEELIIYNETLFTPPKVVFSTDKRSLEIFEHAYPAYDGLIKALLRSYEGIFDFPAAIREEQLARAVALTYPQLDSMLADLHRHGIIEYTPQKEKPQIIFLHDRVKAENLVVNEAAIQNRKKAFERRLKAMIEYSRNQLQCRSHILAVYFNDFTTPACGICDNCINTKNLELSRDEFEEISAALKRALDSQPLTLPDLLSKVPSVNKGKIKRVIAWFQSEHKIVISGEGLMELNKMS